jgi:hypothetical protein
MRSKGPKRKAIPQGVIVNKEKNNETGKSEEPEEGSLWVNIGKIVFLIAGLVAAWFILERLMGSK